MRPSTSDFRPCPGPSPRRHFLTLGGLALGGLGLEQVVAAQPNASAPKTSVILLYLHGGPSQLETYDLKPEAPVEYRSIFKSIPTTVDGMEICELFPLQAKQAKRFSVIRSLHHDVGIHSDGGIVVLTGKRPTVLDETSQSKSEHPDLGSVASARRGFAHGMPPYVAIPTPPYMTRPTYLGIQHAALETGDPSVPNYRPARLGLSGGKTVAALENRRDLLSSLDRFRSGVENDPVFENVDAIRAQAFQLLTSTAVAEAFDLTREPDSLRDRYGRNLWGQGCLLARRLAERGSAVISLFIDTPKSGDDFTNWDDHIQNAGRPGHFGKYMKVRLPYLDQCLATLIEDLFDRGLDRQVMVVVVGEFGRTPKLSTNANGTGRDHWPQAYSALVSGGGLRMGQVVGSTNARAEYPADRPYTPQDLLATVYRHLGISTEQTFLDHTGRPVRILESGAPIPELV